MTAPSRPGLAVAALGVQAFLAVMVVAVSASHLGALVVAVRGPVVFADDVPTAAWFAPPLVGGGLLAACLIGFARGHPARAAATWAVLITLGATLLGRALEPAPTERGWTSALDAPPTVQTVEALKRIREIALKAIAEGHGMPGDDALLGAIAVEGHPLHPGYLYAGLRRRDFRVVRIAGATGPVEDVLPGDLAGTLYVAVSSDAKRFWLSGVVLLDDNGYRTSAMLPGPSGVAVLTNAPRS